MKATLAALRTTAEGKGQELLLLTAEFSQEGDRWVAVCQELGTSSYGTDFEDAKQQLEEAVLLQLNEVKRLGFSNAYLEEHGVKPIQIPSHKGKKPSDQWDLTPLVV